MVRVLVADEDARTRETCARTLRAEGHVVDLAATGADGLRLALTHDVDLVLAELQLSDLDALTLLERLRDAGVHRPFVVMTRAGSATTAFEAGRLGVAAYVEKPIRAQKLRRIVRVHARRHPVASTTERTSAASSHTELALRLIEERYMDPSFGIHETATSCGVTREHLARVIRDDTRRTFTQLLRSRRMSEARRLLATTDLRIKEIYLQVGLTSASEFDHAFKHTWRVSPKTYRLICRRRTPLKAELNTLRTLHKSRA